MASFTERRNTEHLGPLADDIDRELYSAVCMGLGNDAVVPGPLRENRRIRHVSSVPLRFPVVEFIIEPIIIFEGGIEGGRGGLLSGGEGLEIFEPIGGLFAVGNMQGDFFANSYPVTCPGANHGRSVCFGHLVGAALAEGKTISGKDA